MNFCLKRGAIQCNEAEVSITNPNGRPMLPFDWLIHSSLNLASCHKIMFFCFLRLINKLENLNAEKIQTDCIGNIFYLRLYGYSSASYLKVGTHDATGPCD